MKTSLQLTELVEAEEYSDWEVFQLLKAVYGVDNSGSESYRYLRAKIMGEVEGRHFGGGNWIIQDLVNAEEGSQFDHMVQENWINAASLTTQVKIAARKLLARITK